MTETSKFGGDNWYGQAVETKSDPMIDTGTGNPIILRTFQFTANPEVLKKYKPTKQELFTTHAQQIRTMLWADGLQPIDIIPPRVELSKKREAYRIFITCQPRRDILLNEKPQLLQTLLKNNVSNNTA